MTDTVLREYGEGTYGDAYYGVPRLDPVPFFLVEVKPGTEWVDVSCDVRAMSIHRGRSKMLDAWAASTATLTFADFTDRYNAWNPEGVWTVDSRFRTDVPIRVSMELNGTRRLLFSGTTDNVADSWPNAGADALTTVQATDGFKALARNKLALTTAAELSGARVHRILTAAGYTGVRTVDMGLSTMAATPVDAVAVDALDEVRESEWGYLYVNSDGAVVYRQRDARATDPRMTTVQWTFDDTGAAGACYSDLVLVASDDEVINVANVTRTGGTVQHAQDDESLSWYRPRTYTRTNVPLVNDVDTLALAQTVVADHAYNERRVDALVFHPVTDSRLYDVAFGVRMLDRVRVIRRTNVVIDAELLVQGIRHEITAMGDERRAGSWTCTLDTTNARSVRDAGIWDRSGWDVDKWSV